MYKSIIRRKHIFVFILILLFTTAISANLRAPYIFIFQKSGNLKTSDNSLIVQNEKLSFDLPLPYENAEELVKNKKRHTKVKAEYNILASNDSQCSFEFILPDPAELQILINSKKVTPGAPEKMDIKKNRRRPGDLYKVKFSGQIIKGKNRIEVSYKQPISLIEESHGYFSKSRWSSSFGYEIWPLKEWKLADDFSLEINIAMPDERTSFKKLFSYKYDCAIVADTKFKEKKKLISMNEIKDKNYFRKEVVLKKDLPDEIIIVFAEKKVIDNYYNKSKFRSAF